MVANHAAAETQAPMLNDDINSQLAFQLSDTTSRRVLEDLDVASYDHVVTLSYSDDLDAQSAVQPHVDHVAAPARHRAAGPP